MEPLIIGAVVLAFIAFAVWGAYAAAQRKKELTAWAQANGLSFSTGRDGSFDDRYGAFDALRRGSNRYAHNIMRGRRDDRPVCAFDYHYETYSRDKKGRRQTHHHHFSAVIVDCPLPLKPLRIRPEGFFDKVTEFFGMDDIDFELDAFSRAFHVTSPDKPWAFDVIHQATMEFLLSAPRFTIHMEGGAVMVYRGGTMKADTFGSALDVACGILDRLPRYLLNEMKSEGGT